MKKFFFAFCACILLQLLHCALLLAQDDKAPATKELVTDYRKNILKLNLLSPLIRSLNLFYERLIHPEMSLQFSAFYRISNPNFIDTDFEAFGLTAELRYYLSDKKVAPAGFFISPYLAYHFYKGFAEDFNSPSNIPFRNHVLGGGLTIGGQWVFKKRVTLDVWGGPGYYYVNATSRTVNGGPSFSESSGVGGRLGCTLGFAF